MTPGVVLETAGTRITCLGKRSGREGNHDRRCLAFACLCEDDARTASYLLGPKDSLSAQDASHFEMLL